MMVAANLDFLLALQTTSVCVIRLIISRSILRHGHDTCVKKFSLVVKYKLVLVHFY